MHITAHLSLSRPNINHVIYIRFTKSKRRVADVSSLLSSLARLSVVLPSLSAYRACESSLSRKIYNKILGAEASCASSGGEIRRATERKRRTTIYARRCSHGQKFARSSLAVLMGFMGGLGVIVLFFFFRNEFRYRRI